MAWDGIPEHRNLHGGGESPLDPEQRKAYLKRIIEAGSGAQTPPVGEMPPDPFSGSLPGAIAQAEMLASLIEGGFTEPQALYYLACLVQVGLAMRMGRFTGEMPPWPHGEPE
jgi:hypothetical protein